MRCFVSSVAVLLLAFMLTGCSDSPAPAAKKEAEPPPAPITGRQAFQYMFGSARLWAADSQPLSIRSGIVPEVKNDAGKAGAWEVVFISESLGRARTYTWSAVETEGWHKGVFPGQQSSWSPGATQPFEALQIKVDTPEALANATKAAADYLSKPGQKPPINYVLEFPARSRFTTPVWRVLWGGTVSSAEFMITVDASSGEVVGKN